MPLEEPYLPQHVGDVTIAFPAGVNHLMPDIDVLKKLADDKTYPYTHKWMRLFEDWFYHGLTALNVVPKEGVESSKAIRHLKVVANSRQFKHEHKMAAFALLCDTWFEEEGTEWTAATEKRVI